MPGVVYYSDFDSFLGAAGTDINNRLTNNGNVWVAPNVDTQRLLLNGAGTISCGLGTGGGETAYYQVLLADPALDNLTRDDSLNQIVTMNIIPFSGIPARIWMIGLMAGVDTANFSARMIGLASKDFPGTATTLHSVFGSVVNIGIYDTSFSGFSSLNMATFAKTFGSPQIQIRMDSYQLLSQVDFGDNVKTIFYNYDMSFLNQFTQSALRSVGIMAFDKLADAGAPKINTFLFDFYRTTPAQIVPVWREWGSTLAIEAGDLNFGMPTSTQGVISSVASLTKVGGYEVLIPKLHADRQVEAHMLQLDNRLNAGVVDVFIGPFRWRASAGSEMEIPLNSSLNRDRISLRGGGGRATLRVFGTAIPTSFRQ